MEDAPGDAARFEPWKHLGTELYRRRYELFALAAPVLRERGYRGATIRALAHACHLSPAGLYHYFDSKAALATYPLWAPRMRWETTFVDPHADPLGQVGALIESGIRNAPLYLLAIRMHEEIEGPADSAIRAGAFREGEAVFARLLAEAAPSLTRPEAERLARDVLAALVGSFVTGLDPDERDVRERLVGLLRLALVPGAVAPERFDAAMGRSARTERIGTSVRSAPG